jgi:phosphate transport system protein
MELSALAAPQDVLGGAMGVLFVGQVAQAVYALTQFSGETATHVLLQEERVNQMEVEIDREVRGDLAATEAAVEKQSQALRVDAELDALKKSLGK